MLSAHLEGGYIHALQSAPGEFRDAIRLNDRFFGAQLRGFDIRGIGPRIQRFRYVDTDGNLDTSKNNVVSDSLGGRAYYMGRIELEFPTNSALKNMGLRPSAFVDIGSVWGVTRPELAGDDGKIGICVTPSLTDVDPEAVARAVFTVLQMHVTEGEIEDVRHILPSEIRELWPEVPQVTVASRSSPAVGGSRRVSRGLGPEARLAQ